MRKQIQTMKEKKTKTRSKGNKLKKISLWFKAVVVFWGWQFCGSVQFRAWLAGTKEADRAQVCAGWSQQTCSRVRARASADSGAGWSWSVDPSLGWHWATSLLQETWHSLPALESLSSFCSIHWCSSPWRPLESPALTVSRQIWASSLLGTRESHSEPSFCVEICLFLCGLKFSLHIFPGLPGCASFFPFFPKLLFSSVRIPNLGDTDLFLLSVWHLPKSLSIKTIVQRCCSVVSFLFSSFFCYALFLFLFSETSSCFVVQVGLELTSPAVDDVFLKVSPLESCWCWFDPLCRLVFVLQNWMHWYCLYIFALVLSSCWIAPIANM